MPEPKANILVASYSRDGSIEALAKAISEGAREAGAEVRLRRVPDEEERRAAKSPRMEAIGSIVLCCTVTPVPKNTMGTKPLLSAIFALD